MAKVTNPLLSGQASGQFGHMMIFDKRGRVRKYVIPANPKSTAQMDVRNTLGDIQRELKLLGAKLRGELKSSFGSQWNSMIVGELTKNSNAALSAYAGEYTAFSSQNKTDWGTADTVAPVLLTKGEVLYQVASAVYDISVRLGVTIDLAQPSASNSATVGSAWTANS